MAGPDYASLVAGQRAYFLSGKTRPVAWRVEQLKAIRTMIDESRDAMCEALWHDLRRNETDADLMDVDFNIREVDHALDHLDNWLKIEHVHTPVVMEPAHVSVRREPLGVSLIIGAWNEPYMLTLGPLVAAVAAGNTAVVKPSEIAEACAALLAEIVPKYLDPQAVAVVQGAVPETTALLAQKWDMIFSTGSPPVGKIVHQAAAQHLTPAVLELGGKNPTIVHSSADVRTAARRIAYGRYANSGHICTAPDHVLVWPEVKDELVAQLRDAIHDFYGDDPKQSPDYGRVINQRNFDRLAAFLDNGTIAVGGESDAERAVHRADRARRRPGRVADHAGRGLRADPAGARDRLGRGGDRLGQRSSAAARPVRVRRGRGRRGADPRGDGLRRRLRERLHGPPADPGAAVRWGGELRYGQVPRPLGFRGVHQRPRRAVPQPEGRPGRQVSRRTPSTSSSGVVDKLM